MRRSASTRRSRSRSTYGRRSSRRTRARRRTSRSHSTSMARATTPAWLPRATGCSARSRRRSPAPRGLRSSSALRSRRWRCSLPCSSGGASPGDARGGLDRRRATGEWRRPRDGRARHGRARRTIAEDREGVCRAPRPHGRLRHHRPARSEEHTSELQSLTNLVCRLLLEKKKKKQIPLLHSKKKKKKTKSQQNIINEI